MAIEDLRPRNVRVVPLQNRNCFVEREALGINASENVATKGWKPRDRLEGLLTPIFPAAPVQAQMTYYCPQPCLETRPAVRAEPRETPESIATELFAYIEKAVFYEIDVVFKQANYLEN